MIFQLFNKNSISKNEHDNLALPCYHVKKCLIKKSNFHQSGISSSALHEMNKTENFLQTSNERCILQTHNNLDHISNGNDFIPDTNSKKELSPGIYSRRCSQVNNIKNAKKSHSP